MSVTNATKRFAATPRRDQSRGPSTGRAFFQRASDRAKVAERGAALIEFALIALVLYFLLGAVVELGRLVFSAQVAQAAAQTAARELALVPLAANATFKDALDDSVVRDTIYNKDLLVIDLAAIPVGQSLQDVARSLPLVNRILLPLMIPDTIDAGGRELDILRFPGALVPSDLSSGAPALNPTGLTVRVPRVLSRAENGIETIDWVDVVGEILADPSDPDSGPFRVGVGLAGVVAVQVHVPFQAALLSGYRHGAGGVFDPNIDNVNQADDASVSQIGDDIPRTLVQGTNTTYSGPYGLGHQYALAKDVRPFRRLVTTQSVFRREVFQETLP